MSSLITTKTGDKIVVDESPSAIQKIMHGNMVVLTLRSTPRRVVMIDTGSIESIRQEPS